MSAGRETRCSALLTEPSAFRAVATLQLTDGGQVVLREATVAYAVSPRLANASEVLAAGLRRSARAWQTLAL